MSQKDMRKSHPEGGMWCLNYFSSIVRDNKYTKCKNYFLTSVDFFWFKKVTIR